ncbi:MAG TPA: prepilin-type N-terminal cleavage/methylation domain-containing protein [Armatimonadota bacterium]|jgi:prepilin-type N-terminal cleavage/methylation domain-containing protein/prepilin-type processing-associated H-X9-DG protein
MRTGRKAFTLIELLVVIAIIAILAAILFPVFAKARERARQSTCSQHSREYALAYLQYMDQWEDTVPPWTDSKNHHLQDYLQPFIKSYAIFTCPSDTFQKTKNGPAGENDGYSFWRNSYLDRWSGYLPNSPITSSEIRYPSTTVFIVDGPNNAGQHTWGLNPSNPLQKQYPDYRFGDTRHSGGGTYAFMDGHTKWYLPDQIKTTHTDSDTDTEPRWQSPLHPKLPTNDGTNPWFRP